ncbi:hypothetical protein CTAYLR_007565 [Chrysophaeum taylorii]|uniref:Uncharacterized protein n=1 Tax=Chrysophaeum taylorii TaxID=2483200 RepID=A0AAD7UEE1_9STRA|nr:hypothetical protein CTAYLR_007565 [Chrysophaeum taylorii]
MVAEDAREFMRVPDSKEVQVEVISHHKVDDGHGVARGEWPEFRASFWSQLTYSYIDDLLDLGAASGTLTAGDLPRIVEVESSRRLLRCFEESTKGARGALLEVGRSPMMAAAFWQAWSSVGQVAEPLLLRALVLSSAGRGNTLGGLAVTALIALNAFAKSAAQQRQLHLATRAGQRVRACAIATAYARALRRREPSASISTLAAVDATKLFEVSLDAHLIWSCPLQVVVVCILLVAFVGSLVAALAGVACLIAVLPWAKGITHKLIALRRKRAPISDARIAEVSEVIGSGIRVTKFSGWELLWEKRWHEARQTEIDYTRREMFWLGLSLLAVVMAPVIATIVTVCVKMLTDRDARLTPADAFTIISLISAVRFPINKLGTLIGQVAQAWRSLDRIADFVGDPGRRRRDDDDGRGAIPRQENENENDDVVLRVRRAAFVRGESSTPPTFVAGRASRLDLDARRGDLVAVLGEVGSGKSTYLGGLLGNVEPLDDRVEVTISGAVVGLAPQEPCVLNATIRDNVTFGSPFDAARFELAIKASQLVHDLDEFPAGEFTEIGERGVTLSGGQKARLGLARVVYARPRVAILDDPLSALDAKTARAAFDALFDTKTGALRDAAVVLVTHAAHLAPRASRIVYVDDAGDVGFNGTWRQALDASQTEAADPATRALLAPVFAASRRGPEAVDEAFSSAPPPNAENDEASNRRRRSEADMREAASASLTSVERREKGMASWATWLRWCRAAGGSKFLTIQLVALALDRACYVSTEWWLARWADARVDGASIFGNRFPSQRDGLDGAWRWARVYLCLGAASTVFCMFRTQWGFFCGVTAAKRLYDDACHRVLSAPVRYFDETPTGRIVSRFSYDTEQVDIVLTQKAAIALISVGWAVTGAAVMLTLSSGTMAVILVPVALVFRRLQQYYRRSSVDLQRLDAVSRSPIQQLLVEAVDANASIRAFGARRHFEKRFFEALDANTEALLCWTAAQRWIGLRLDACAATVATFAALVVAVLRRRVGLSEAFAGMLLVWAFQLTTTFMYLITSSSEAENAVTSVERVTEPVPNEFDAVFDRKKNVLVDAAWPTKGDLVFDNVCMRYRPGLPLALDHLSFRVPSGARCGVVGRSGAGKSSILHALFRLTPLGSGDVRVDGAPLSQLDLRVLRRRVAQIVPQDPVLFSGSLRNCVDPFGSRSDDDVARALALVAPPRDDAPKTWNLDTRVEDAGANFSVGERQLLALARALLQQPKILVLDEATSSLDDATDARIQHTLRTLPQLRDTTVLCIAHRLATIIDFDLVCVMHQGRCAEFGAPAALADNRAGLFAALVDSTGRDTATALRAAAKGDCGR